jgi:hypothetical protein
MQFCLNISTNNAINFISLIQSNKILIKNVQTYDSITNICATVVFNYLKSMNLVNKYNYTYTSFEITPETIDVCNYSSRYNLWFIVSFSILGIISIIIIIMCCVCCSYIVHMKFR